MLVPRAYGPSQLMQHGSTQRSRQASPVRLLLVTILCASATTAVTAQEQTSKETFPPKGWQEIKLKDKERQRLRYRSTAQLTPKNVFQLQFKRPAGYSETVITKVDGVVLARGKGTEFEIEDCGIGDRYVIHLIKEKEQRSLRLLESFIEFPQREFPGKEWRPRREGTLDVIKPKQSTPKNMFEAFDKPHQITFTATATDKPMIFVLTKIEPGGKEQIASQSLTGALKFWMHAKRGESFRIYQLFPHDKTYRASTTMTVEKSFPLGN